MTNIRIIPAKLVHQNYIFDSFVREYSRIHDIPTAIPWSKLFAILHSDKWKCVVAISPDDEDEIMGWLLYRDSSTLGWVNVKKAFRQWGVATALLAHADVCKGSVDVAFYSPKVAKLAKEKGYVLRWRPYISDTAEIELAELFVNLEGLE